MNGSNSFSLKHFNEGDIGQNHWIYSEFFQFVSMYAISLTGDVQMGEEYTKEAFNSLWRIENKGFKSKNEIRLYLKWTIDAAVGFEDGSDKVKLILKSFPKQVKNPKNKIKVAFILWNDFYRRVVEEILDFTSEYEIVYSGNNYNEVEFAKFSSDTIIVIDELFLADARKILDLMPKAKIICRTNGPNDTLDGEIMKALGIAGYLWCQDSISEIDELIKEVHKEYLTGKDKIVSKLGEWQNNCN